MEVEVGNWLVQYDQYNFTASITNTETDETLSDVVVNDLDDLIEAIERLKIEAPLA